MKILHTVKYYSPSKGGMESVVKNIVDGITACSKENLFTVYANNHLPLYKRKIHEDNGVRSIKEFTPFLLRSQPLSIRYTSLRDLLLDTDIVHHHYPFPNMELALLRHQDILAKKKLIITWHANIKNSRWSWIEKFYNPIIKKLLDIAEHVVVTSPQLLNFSEILTDYTEKVKVIPLSFDPAISSNIISRAFPEGRRFRLLFVGKLRSYKGLKFLIESIKYLDVELTIVGEGENEQALRKQVYTLRLQDKIKFLKEVSNEALISIYQKSDLFILPSINEAEAFGVVQLEAMCNGLPVINTQLESGVPFVSLDNFSGITVEPQNVESLRNAIEKIITNKALYEQFSKNSVDRSKEFARGKMAQSYFELYNS